VGAGKEAAKAGNVTSYVEGICKLISGDTTTLFDSSCLPHRVTIVAGGYGSGKSEVAVNLAMTLAKQDGVRVSIADLDVVNPYFRSREAAKFLATLGVHSIVPQGSQFHADLPIILPEVKGAIESGEGRLIVDAGGDDVGATVLSSFIDVIKPGAYDMVLVLNASRPFSQNLSGCRKIIADIERASRLKFTGIISNTHLIDHTTPQMVIDGLKLTKEVAEETGVPVLGVAATGSIMDQLTKSDVDVPVLRISRKLLKPWEREQT